MKGHRRIHRARSARGGFGARAERAGKRRAVRCAAWARPGGGRPTRGTLAACGAVEASVASAVDGGWRLAVGGWRLAVGSRQ
ncbi:hypothetical protein EGT59_06490 [Burkholderia mallei]|nr:hypothetical protein EGT59_06490 [Burkholderia mallei]